MEGSKLRDSDEDIIGRVQQGIAKLPPDHQQIIHLAFDRDLAASGGTPNLRADLRRLAATETQRTVPRREFSFNTGGIVTAALNFGLPSPIDVQVEGKSLETLHEIARTIREVAKQAPGAVDVRIQQEIDYPQIVVKVDRIKAAYLGLTQDEVVKNIVTALNSSTNFKPAFWLDYETGNHYFIGATYREKDISSFETLENILITSSKQRRPVLLKNSATFERATVPTEVAHHRIRRVMDVFANVGNGRRAVPNGRDVGSVAADIERAVKKLNIEQRHPGDFVRFRGEVASMWCRCCMRW
jgi:Cu/Ag efflux pump CusA